MENDPQTRFEKFLASDAEAYVVRGNHVGPWLELTLTRDRRHHHLFKDDSFEPLELLSLQRFRPGDLGAYSEAAGHLEDAAQLAASGRLGYHIHTATQDGKVLVSLVGRVLGTDGRIHTEVSDEQSFDQPDSSVALVQSNEHATELRAKAEQLNAEWRSRLGAQLDAIRAQFDAADEQAAAAEQLQQIVDAEDEA